MLNGNDRLVPIKMNSLGQLNSTFFKGNQVVCQPDFYRTLRISNNMKRTKSLIISVCSINDKISYRTPLVHSLR